MSLDHYQVIRTPETRGDKAVREGAPDIQREVRRHSRDILSCAEHMPTLFF